MLVLKTGAFNVLLHLFVCLYFHCFGHGGENSEQDLRHVREILAMCNFIFIGIMSYLVGPASGHAARSFVITWMFLAWSLRLLFHLIRRAQSRHSRRKLDKRPDQAFDRQQFMKILTWWLGQAVWITCASCTVLSTNLSRFDDVYGFWTIWDRSAVTLWMVGWVMEAVSDDQRYWFNILLDPQYKATHFLSTGLWKWSRHPNYCGTFLHWLGLWMLGVPTNKSRLQSLLFLALSPASTLILLTKFSGIPTSEAHDDRRFGRLPTYLQYKYVTSPFFPLPPSLYAQLEPGMRKWLLFETFQPKVRRVKRTLLSNSLASSPNK